MDCPICKCDKKSKYHKRVCNDGFLKGVEPVLKTPEESQMKFYTNEVDEWRYDTQHSFKGKLFTAYAKADGENRKRLACMFPNLKIAYDMWYYGALDKLNERMHSI